MYHRRVVHKIKHSLRRHHQKVRNFFAARHPHALAIFRAHRSPLAQIRKRVMQGAAATAVAGLLSTAPLNAAPLVEKSYPAGGPSGGFTVQAETNESLVGKLEHALSVNQNGALPSEEEQIIAEALSRRFGMSAKPEIDGKRLNKIIGKIGGEQHLKRYPGDVISAHSSEEDQRPELAGMAPGLGAYGYFTGSGSGLTDEAIQQERYYIAAQTFLSPGWSENPNALYDFFRFRKMLIVNPHTGQGVVAVIGDAGPAEWTGKSFGGSPEVMHHVGYSTGSRKGEVIVLMVDDPENKVPLGVLNVGR